MSPPTLEPTLGSTYPQGFTFGLPATDADLSSLHPYPSLIRRYWKIFLENVQPVTGILHIPTMEKVMQMATEDTSNLSKSMESLLFAIYFAAINSMATDEVKTLFGEKKHVLIANYKSGLEQTLMRAGLFKTQELATLQAFVLFLSCVRGYEDPQIVWTMTGLAIRIAQSIGLHRDGEAFKVSPFETEMRRRLWWSIYMLELDSSESYGSNPMVSEHSFDTKLPLNVNDVDLVVDAVQVPNPRDGWTDMSFCIIRFEIYTMAYRLKNPNPGSLPGQSLNHNLSFSERKTLLEEFQQRMEAEISHRCDHPDVLCWVTKRMTRTVIARAWLDLYHPFHRIDHATSLSEATESQLFIASIELVENGRAMESEPATKKWGWLFRVHVQWHAVAFILAELCIRPPSPITQRAWAALDALFTDWSEAMTIGKNALLWQPMKKLIKRARRKREEQRGMTQNPPPCVPHATQANASTKTAPNVGMTSGTFLLYREPGSSAAQNSLSGVDLSQTDPDLFHVDAEELLRKDMAEKEIPAVDVASSQNVMQTTPWILNDSALLDLDMDGPDDTGTWREWDDIVRDINTGPDEGFDFTATGHFGAERQWH